jgi:2-keto-4-pentenoate hydratase
MKPIEAASAARILAGCWRRGEHIEALPETCRPRSRADGYAVQDRWPEEVGDAIAGWKIAATSAAGQRHIAVSGPLAGPIFARRVHADAATVSLARVGMRVVECEIVFRMGERFPPRDGVPRSRAEVLAAVESVHPGIEVPDSRFAQFEKAGEAQLIADCACMNEMLVGTAVRMDARAFAELRNLRIRARVGDTRVLDGIGANALGDPVKALVWLVNELSRYGRPLEAGLFVTTGTCTTPIPVNPGDVVTVDYGSVGSLGVRLA